MCPSSLSECLEYTLIHRKVWETANEVSKTVQFINAPGRRTYNGHNINQSYNNIELFYNCPFKSYDNKHVKVDPNDTIKFCSKRDKFIWIDTSYLKEWSTGAAC